MIVKIIGKTSFKGLQNGLNYIMDKQKCIGDSSNSDDIISEFKENAMKILESGDEDDALDYIEQGVSNIISYMKNDNKTKKKFVSGYMCDPESAQEEFIAVITRHMQNAGKTINDVTGNISYHLVQSFPEELDISDEEVHQCGIELLEKLEKYQGVVASHLHPEIKEDGNVHGKCKHNHIIINAYIHPDFIDKEHPDRIKYHDCKETYRQLQIYNDEIALAHGLPIIVSPDFNKTYSWYETNEKNKGKSWKERVRVDIENAQRVTNSWDEFVEHMISGGYQINEGKYVTYTTPDKQKIRDYKLGEGYLKESICSYFEIKRQLKDDIELDNNQDSIIDIYEIINQHPSEQLYIKISKNKSEKYVNENKSNTYDVMIPLNQAINESTYKSYFIKDGTYDICNGNQNLIAQITGKQALQYFKQQYSMQNKVNEEQYQKELDELNNDDFKVNSQNQTFYNVKWISYKSKRPLSIHTYDAYGRRRTVIELSLLLALSFIKKESLYWLDPKVDYSKLKVQNNPIYASRDWKMQSLIDSIEEVKRQDVATPSQLEERLKQAGSKVATIKRKQKSIATSLNNMTAIYEAIEVYEELKDKCNELMNMQTSLEKEKLLRENYSDIEKFKAAASTLHRTQTFEKDQQEAFLTKYNNIKENLEDIEIKLNDANNEYRKLKKIKYNLQLSQSEMYVCGLQYGYDKAMNIKSDDEVNHLSEDEISNRLQKEKSK